MPQVPRQTPQPDGKCEAQLRFTATGLDRPRPERTDDRLWHPCLTLCAVCTSRTRGFGWFDPHRPRPNRTRRWFCSTACQAAFTRKAQRGLTLPDLTEEEHMAILGSLKGVARQIESYGWETRLCDLTETQVLWLIETAVQEFRESMAEIAAHQSAQEIPF